MTLELSNEEVEALQELIKWRVKSLGPEIRHTDKLDYRHGLENLERQLNSLQARLEKAACAAP